MPIALYEKYHDVDRDDEHFYFYKYVAFNTGALGILINNELKYTNPVDFNDPFDCLFSVEIDFKNFNKSNYEEMIGIQGSAKEWFRNREKLKVGIKNRARAGFVEDFRKRISVTCFSSSPLNMLMWSHYACNHTGFLLEFKIPIWSNKGNLPIPVIYSDEYPVMKLHWDIVNFLKNENNQIDLIKKMVLSKAECWSYEKEYRLIHDSQLAPNDALILKEYDPKILSSVIIGAKMCESEYQQIANAVDDFNKKHTSQVKIYKAELAKKEFRIVVPKHPRLSQK
ncbi:DUF2971 domain-containing protein [Acinetobacter sp. CAAS 2-6]|uniref:DUF2971 domain-containing protein n=1 Tax=Acinetobacter sp. CAAS 2-6 TaxID=3016358 RepID=UPI002DD65CD4|nr:DUF2971 domain-containing protein [Acinetobacter sp. CAAS 2-6]